MLIGKCFAPALESDGDTGELGRPNRSNDQDHRAGPPISEEFKLGHTDKIA